MNEEKNSTTEETFALAVQNHEKSNFKEAEILYRKILNINPDHFGAIFLLGTLSAQTKNLDSAIQLLQKAISNYEKAIQLRPNFASAYKYFLSVNS